MSGLAILDVRDPANPSLLGNYNIFSYARGVAAAGDYALVADNNGGLQVFQVFERSRDLTHNAAQCLPLHTSGPVDRIKLIPYQNKTVSWEISADAGSHWLSIPDTNWQILAYPGSELVWRARLEYSEYSVYPSCGSLDIQLDGLVAALITGFEAVVRDGGVELAWDITAEEVVKGFWIYRRAAGPGAPDGLNTGELLNSSGLIPPSDRRYLDTTARAGASYEYTLIVVAGNSREVSSQTITARIGADKLALYQNYPNPFNPSTRISFSLPGPGRVLLSVFNPEGKMVKTLIDEPLPVGYEEVDWDGRDSRGNEVSTGIYLYRLEAGGRTLSKKMILIKQKKSADLDHFTGKHALPNH